MSGQTTPSADAHPGNSIFREGHNCWRVRRAGRASFLIDAAAYFAALVSAIRQARETVYISAWDIDSRVCLLRGRDHENPPLTLSRLLREALERTPGLEIYILAWDFAFIYALEREWFSRLRMNSMGQSRLHFQMDGEHPTAAAHHQKFVVVDDALAFSGGLDLTRNRWDTSQHLSHDPRRTDPPQLAYDPFHDVQIVVNGEAAAALGELFRDRWRWATGRVLSGRSGGPVTAWPENLPADLRDVDVALSRTIPPYKGREGVREVEALYRDMIRRARETIYLESQYLTSPRIGEFLAERLQQPDGPEIVMLLPNQSSGWLEQSTMDALRSRILRHLREVDRYRRLRVFYPTLPDGHDIYIHAKVMITDDRLARVGSANLSNRSLGFDTECDLCLEAGNETAARGVASFRNRLLADHLGTSPQKIDETLRKTGSLIEALGILDGATSRLRPLDPDREIPIDGAALVSDPSLLDPEQPARLDRLIDHFLEEEDSQTFGRRLVKFISVLLALSALAAAWRWTPLSAWVDPGRLVSWAARLQGDPFLSLAGVIGGFVAGGLVMLPVTLMIGVTAMVFGFFPGVLYAMAGCLANASVSYFLGTLLGKATIQKFAGRKLQSLSRRLAQPGILTVALIRNLPVAPFTIVNLVAGAVPVRFKDYILGTAVGMAPGILLLTTFADRFIKALEKPRWSNITLAAAAALILGLVIWWTKKRFSRESDR